MQRCQKTCARISGMLALFMLGWQMMAPVSWLRGLSFETTVSANTSVSSAAPEGAIFAVTAANRLISFNGTTPGAINSNVAITGLQAGETIIGLDFRPRTGQLFALGSAKRLYVLNTATGAATLVGAGPLNPAPGGATFGFNFDPIADRIHLVNDTDQNILINPVDATVTSGDTIAFATGDVNASANPNLVALAYTSNFLGATTRTAYGIDSNLGVLVRLGSVGGAPTPPFSGRLTTVGQLGVAFTGQAGFDIGSGDTAYAALTSSGGTTSSLYTINLNSGQATLIGTIGVADTVRSIAVVPRVETIFAVTTNNNLLCFSSGTPDQVTSVAITNLPPGESIVGIDFRPATGQLYAVSSASRLYLINTATGAATPVSGAALSPPLNGSSFGFDFNPVVDRIRLVSNTGQNLRLNPITGGVAATDTNLAYKAGDPNFGVSPSVVGVAYTNNLAGSSLTTLYGIEATQARLVLIGSPNGTPDSPNTGLLTTVGALGVNPGTQVGFDIAPRTGAAFASFTASGASNSQLYTINLATGAATPVGTIGGGEVVRAIAVAINVEKIFALTSGNKLLTFNSLTPGTITGTVVISGLQAGESVVSIDFRPATGELYGLGSSNRLYRINPITGGAAAVSSAAFTPALSGAAFGLDFNPAVDRLRLVSNTGQNLRLNPDTGTVVAADTDLAYASVDPNAGTAPQVAEVAYTNNVAGASSTTLYAIDFNLDRLVRQGSVGGTPTSPNSGQLFTVGPLGVDTSSQVGFDISDATGTAYAALTTSGATTSGFYTINLVTGAATLVGNIGGTETIRGLAVATTFTASAQPGGIGIVNAASFRGDSIAPDELISLFGAFQTTDGQAAVAPSGPLPTTLGGITVTINGTPTPLIYVSNGQINALVPSSIADGPATVVVTNANGTLTVGTVPVTRSAPGIFALRTSGLPVAAALFTKDGVNYTPTFNPEDGSPRVVDPGSRTTPTYLVLFTTGLRNTPAANSNDANGVAEAVTATIQGIPTTVTYAGKQSEFAGLDQINLIIPPALAGAGLVQVRVSVEGQASNTVVINLGGTPPTVTFQTAALGQLVTGQLTTDDQVQIGPDGRTYFFDAYRFTATVGTTLALDLRASLFDPLVLLYRVNADGSRTLVGSDDNLGGLGNGQRDNDNALLLTVVQQTGTYEVFVTSADDNPNGTGAYTLRLGANAIQSLSFGQTVNGAITTSDLLTSAGDFLDAYYFAGNAGDSVQIKMSAANFDSYLILNLNNGTLVATDDNSGGGPANQDALISLTLPETGIYVIIATPFKVNVTGNYTLSLTRGSGTMAAPQPQLEADGASRHWQAHDPASATEQATELGTTAFDRHSFRRVMRRE